MGSGRDMFIRELEALRDSSRSDFLAFAMPAPQHQNMRWTVILGSRNGRVEQMRIKPGIGIGGMVLRHGTIYRADDRENSAMLLECPVMLAEKLVQGIAYPAALALDEGPGIVLLGRRNIERYDESELQPVQDLLQRLLSGTSA